MIKVCHVTSAHKRYDGRVFKKELTSLSKEYDCYLICCDGLKDEIKNNVHIISASRKFKNRYERFLKAKKYLKIKANEVDADIYHFHDADLLPLADYFSKKGKKVIFDYHENFEDLFLEREWIPKIFRKFLQRSYIRKEKKVLPKLSGIIASSEHIRKKVFKYNKNAINIENFPILTLLPKKVKKENTLCFAGTISSFWNHDKICEAIADIDNINYVIAGEYSEKDCEKLSKCKGFDKVKLIGRIDYNEVLSLYNKSMIGIALCSYRPNVDYQNGSLGITKIFEFMMSEIPVIFTDFKVFKEINEKSKFGISVNPYNVNEIKEAILYLINHPDEAKEMAKNGRKLVENKYNWSVLEERLLDFYKKI